MSAKTNVTKGAEGAVPVERAGGEQASDSGPAVLPRVDVYEDAGGITLTADLPGVSQDRLSLQLDGNSLRIEGEASLDAPEALQAVYAEVRNARFRRGFTLSSELDTSAVQATLRDGVLTVRLPKKEAHRPRRIEVQAG